jgi:hypothetical protein
MSAKDAEKPLVLRFGGRLVEQLGAQLYPRVTASVAELVSNAWDADAKNVWITIPFDQDWKGEAVIEVLDDGIGMTREEAAQKYLIVGRNRRLDKSENGDVSPGGRHLHGRKGIGKLAAFGTAAYLECVTLRDGEETAFGIDYDDLREHEPNVDYQVEAIDPVDPLVSPKTGEPLEHGTRVRLTRLKAKRKTGETSFKRSMERRFALDSEEMQVWINGKPLKRYDVPLQVRFPRDGVPPRPEVSIDSDGWATDRIPYPTKDDPDATRLVRWWIGFTETPIADEGMRGISVLSRGKLAQRPFMFERGLGTTGQLGQEYLVGEVAADWLDHGVKAEEDLIQSNRDQLQLDNAELEPFMTWGRSLLRWALAKRNIVKREQNVGEGALGKQVEQVLGAAPAASRERLRTLAGRIADITQADQSAVADAVRAVVEATEAGTAERIATDLSLEGDPDDSQTWELLDEAFQAILPGQLSVYQARRDALKGFLVAVEEPPVERLHAEVSNAPWIISPLLHGLPSEVLREDDEFVLVRWSALPPVLTELKVGCWAVGATPSADKADVEADLFIASTWESPADDRLSWRDVLKASIEAHETISSSLNESDGR